MQVRRTWAIRRYRHYIHRANFGTKTLSYILFLSNFLFKICTSIHHMVLYITISIKETLISFSKAVNIFVLSSVTDISFYKTRVSRHSGCWINDIKYCRTWIFLHIICLSYTLISRNAGWWDSMHFTNKHQVSFSYYFKFDRIMYVLMTF